jgi:hypothetical protein
MKVQTAIAVARSSQALQSLGIKCDFYNIDSAEIVTARDMFANMLLYSSDWDAMLFVDSDMGFEPDLAIKLVSKGVDVAAAACPRRRIDLPRFSAALQSHGDVEKARAEASNFTVHFNWDNQPVKTIQVADGFCRAAAVGMAIALISKQALQAMVAGKVVDPRHDLSSSGGEPCWSFFSNLENKGERLGEDYSFCYRWTKLMKKELLVCIDEEVNHVGDFDYKGKFSNLL